MQEFKRKAGSVIVTERTNFRLGEGEVAAMGRPRNEGTGRGNSLVEIEAHARVMQGRATIRGREQAKREQLQAEIAADRRRPLFDQLPAPSERREIALEMRRGLISQSGFPGAWRTTRT